MMDRLRACVDAGWLVSDPVPDEEVVGLWTRGLGAWSDAHVAANTDEARIIRAYDAGRFAATAIVRAHNFRVRAQNHHEHTLRAAGLLGGEDLEDLLNEFDRVRRLRTEAEYGWRSSPVGTPLARATELVARILELSARELQRARPAIATQIAVPQ